MFDYISIKGIETNNLKGIDIRIAKNDINLIIGPSGSGKSSLAYDTVAQIGNHELGCMFDSINEPEYKVASYENMIVTIPLKQQNYNNNVRSTIGTYFSPVHFSSVNVSPTLNGCSIMPSGAFSTICKTSP